MDHKKTIKVTGRGRIRLKPDVTRITVTLEKVFPEYAEALERSAADTEELKDVLAGLGFDRTAPKTLHFDIAPEYEGYQEQGEYKQRLVGYRYSHVMKLDFDSDNDRLGKILYALAHGALNPEFTISYTVKDRESAKNALLGNAVSDAAAKAEILAKAAGVKRGELIGINYAWDEPDLEVRPMNRKLTADECAVPTFAGGFSLNIEPDDIELSDTVTMLWAIL